MQIHLSKPGGQREGPFTIDQINRDLANRKYRDADYWAWYEGLDAWVPLHAVPGILILPEAANPPAVPQAAPVKAPAQKAAAPMAQPKTAQPASDDGQSETAMAASSAADVDSSSEIAGLASGFPFSALRQFYIFTAGDGPSAMKSPITAKMVKAIVGEDLARLREKVPRDVFGRCDIAERLRKEKTIPASAWRAMSSLNAELVQQAREGSYRTCVRIFPIENNEWVALFLFYEKAGK